MTITETVYPTAEERAELRMRGQRAVQIAEAANYPCPSWCSRHAVDGTGWEADGHLASRCHYSNEDNGESWGIGWTEYVDADGNHWHNGAPEVDATFRSLTTAETCREVAMELVRIAEHLERDSLTA